jgi:uncharacterized protein (DUF362 family)
VDLLGGIEDIVKPGQNVLINPNLTAALTKREQAVITLPEVTHAVADIVKSAKARPIIAESSMVGLETERVISDSGYQQLREIGYEVLDLKKEKPTMIPVRKGKIFKEIQSYKLVKDVDVIISVPKLKTHDQAELTLSIKNLKGLLTDKYMRKFHELGVFMGCVDWFSVLKPKLAVVDGIYCQEGVGPVFGKPVEMDLIVAGYDLVAVDAVCGYITGFEPDDVPITAEAARRRLGMVRRKDIEIIGKPIESVSRRFMRVVEDERLEIEGANILYGGVACSGCRIGIMSSLFDMKEANQLVYLEDTTIVAGNPEIPEHIREASIVTVGQCVPCEKRSKRHVIGCPPKNANIVEAIVGDRIKVQHHY